MTLDELPFIINNSYFTEYKNLVFNYSLEEGYTEDYHIICPELNMSFSSIKEASIKLNMSDGVICQVLNKKQKSIHGLTFIKLDKEKYYEKRACEN